MNDVFTRKQKMAEFKDLCNICYRAVVDLYTHYVNNHPKHLDNAIRKYNAELIL